MSENSKKKIQKPTFSHSPHEHAGQLQTSTVNYLSDTGGTVDRVHPTLSSHTAERDYSIQGVRGHGKL